MISAMTVAQFENNTEQVTESGCLLWVGPTSPSGYGRISINGSRKAAHRVAWEVAHGTIPDGLCICHHCDVPPCVNVDHLFLGTQGDNVRDAIVKGRAQSPTHRAELSKRMKGNKYTSGLKLSAETRAKMSASRVGNQNAKGTIFSPEARAKISATHKGKPKSVEHRRKIGLAGLGRQTFLGRKHSPETIARMSVSQKGHPGYHHSDEERLRISVSVKAAWVIRRKRDYPWLP